MSRETLSLPTATLSYLDIARGDTTLLFVHGAFINKSYWQAQLDHFRADYRVVALDLAGHGDSINKLPHRSVQDYATEVRALIETLSLKRVVLVGHSFGSDIALELIAADPTDIIGLVEVDHLKRVGQEPPADLIAAVVAGLRADFAGTAAAFARQALLTEHTDPALVARLFADYARTDPAAGVQIFEGIPGYAQREVELLGRLPVTLHAIHVDYAPTDEAALAQATAGHYALHRIAGTCHYPMAERSGVFNRALAEALESVLRTAPGAP